MDMDKAVRWAIGSIVKHPNNPTTTLMILPDWRAATAYQRWLAHPLVHELLTIQKNVFQFQTPDFWKTGNLFVGHPKWDVKVLLIANPSGRTAHFDPNRLQLNLTKAANLLGWVPPKVNSMMHVMHTKNYTANTNVTATFSIPTKLRKLVDHSSDDSDNECGMDYKYSQAASTNAEPDILSLLSEIQPLLLHNDCSGMPHQLFTQTGQLCRKGKWYTCTGCRSVPAKLPD
jgi:hypothetical protein